MSPLKTSLLITILVAASACGRQVVEFKNGDLDAGIDSSVDASFDAPIAVRPVVTSTMPVTDATGVALNTSVTATFSKPMNAGTLTTTTFTLRQGTTVLTGGLSVNTAGTIATFDPNSDFTAGLVYTATITTGAEDTGGMALAANYTWSFTAAANALRPTVTSTMPSPNGTNVAIAVSPTATFSKAMMTSTINATTFTLAQGATPIVGVVTLNGATNTATFDPTVNLTAGLVYTATITTGAMDTGGLALAANYTWMFTTGTGNVLPPTVTSTTPAPGAMNVALNVSPTALFDQTMNTATINMTTFTLSQGATPIAGTVTLDVAGTTATFNPTVDLTAGLVYTATITTGAQGTNGMFLATNRVWMFTAGTAAVAPMVTSTTPAPGALNVPLNVSPTALFNQTMNGATINMLTFTLSQGVTPIGGTVMLDVAGTTATFNPTVDLTAGLVYTAQITTGAQGTNGLFLATNHTWMFTAGASCVLAPVVLGTAAPFAILAGSTVTNTGPSVVTGDLGVWMGTAVTGFGPANGTLIGTEYAGTTPAMIAQGDLTIAYNDAAGRTLCLTSLIGDLGGLTLPPGLYKSTSFMELTTGDLVLDAQGDPNAVWIFSMVSMLTVANSRQVTIIGGGSSANVFWQVGSSAMIGTGATFRGTIMADQAITMATGTVLDGRALARIAEVTLQSNMVTRP